MLHKNFSFEVLSQNEKARVGKINTPRGNIDTPAFMPVGTLATVKGIYTDDILKTGTQIILGNTYHLLFCLAVILSCGVFIFFVTQNVQRQSLIIW